MVGPFEFTKPETVMLSAGNRIIAISVWDSKGEKHEFVGCPELVDGAVQIWFGAREDFETRALA